MVMSCLISSYFSSMDKVSSPSLAGQGFELPQQYFLPFPQDRQRLIVNLRCLLQAVDFVLHLGQLADEPEPPEGMHTLGRPARRGLRGRGAFEQGTVPFT